MAVNLSPRQIFDSDIVRTVTEVLSRWKLPGDALWLEITEGVMMNDTVEAQAVLNSLRGLGVSLSVDDFGTGFSSLSYLRRYPVSKLKIDKSFVDGLGDVDADCSLVAAIIAMAQALNLATVAEGVETAAQADLLFGLGCRSAQGFHFARPMSAGHVPLAIRRMGCAPPSAPSRPVPTGDRLATR
jgi:EAL domain-containing protein (putative c-di-GMP-specific phosphodiesterase class I)